MRRFNLVDDNGTVRGEGVAWRDRRMTYRVNDGPAQTVDSGLASAGGEFPTTLAELDIRWLDDVPVAG